MSKRPNAGRRGAATDRAPGGTTIGKSGTEPVLVNLTVNGLALPLRSSRV